MLFHLEFFCCLSNIIDVLHNFNENSNEWETFFCSGIFRFDNRFNNKLEQLVVIDTLEINSLCAITHCTDFPHKIRQISCMSHCMFAFHCHHDVDGLCRMNIDVVYKYQNESQTFDSRLFEVCKLSI